MLSPHSTLISYAKAAKLLGISQRELELWHQFSVGLQPITIRLAESGATHTAFIQSEVELLARDNTKIKQIQEQLKPKVNNHTPKNRKKQPFYD